MRSAGKQGPRPSAKDRTRLSPEHRKILRRYGLSDSTIDGWGCTTISEPDQLGSFAAGVEPPGIALPILSPGAPQAVAFIYKPDNPRVSNKNGKVRKRKYEHPVQGLNRIHMPRPVQDRLFGHDRPDKCIRLVITEGPIKAEKAAQEGIACVGLPGVWNWRQKFGGESVPIEDLSKIPWQQFTAVEICFDSDAATNLQVRRAERALAAWLLQHGAAKVLIVRLSSAEDGTKVGLDDFLRVHSAEDYEKLPRLAPDVEPPLEEVVSNLTPDIEKAERNPILGRILDEEHDPGEQERLFKLAARLTKIPVRALRASGQAEATRTQTRRREDQANQLPLSAEEAREAAEKQHAERTAAVEAILNNAHGIITLRAQKPIRRGTSGYFATFGEAGSLLVTTHGVRSVANLPANYRVTDPPP